MANRCMAISQPIWVFRGLVLITLLIAPVALGADGMVFDRASFRPLIYNEQRAVILHRNGVERLVIGLKGPEELLDEARNATGAVWIFPIPANPEEVRVDLVDSFPVFSGRDVAVLAFKRLLGWFTYTQVPIPTFLAVPYYSSYGAGVRVKTHAQVDRWGIHAEVISAKSVTDLRQYLLAKGVPAQPNTMKSFTPYLTAKHCLVVGWISSPDEIRKKFPVSHEHQDFRPGSRPGLYVQFPAKQGFYPLAPTSGYGDARVKISLFVLGHVNPDQSALERSIESDQSCNRLRDSISVRYFSLHARSLMRKGMDFRETAPKQLIEAVPDTDLRYTRILMECRAKCLAADLRFTSEPPPGIRLIDALLDNDIRALLMLLSFIALLCYVCGGLAGLVVFRQWNAYALMGLWSLLTLVALYIALRRSRGRRGENPRAARFLAVFTLIYHILTIPAVLFALRVWLPLLSKLVS